MDQDADPGEVPAPAGTLKGDPLVQETAETTPVIALNSEVAAPCTTMETSGPSQEPGQSKHRNPRWPTGDQYGPDNPRRSSRRKPHGQ